MKSVAMNLLFILSLSAVYVAESFDDSKLFFLETFDKGDIFENGKWFKSKDDKYVDQPVLLKATNKPLKGFENDKGITLSQDMKFYGVATTFPEPLITEGKDFVVQYELKLEENLGCGGAYIKLPRMSDIFESGNINNETPYTVMFGPDKCGSNNKVHFILQHRNPISDTWQEKHFNETPPIRSDNNHHLYTLHVKKDNTFEVFIDMKSIRSGSLLTHMNPPVNPPREIDDPDDLKPVDWVDVAEISDPEARKPDDWDEDAPRMIVNENAKKPEGWEDDAPLEVADPEARKPEDWDDEEDGHWSAPMVSNPICATVGCGQWTAPMMQNPAHKGKWNPPKIPNPAYIGVWAPKKIPNPHYFVDNQPSNMAPMLGMAIEVWTINGGIHFDNFLISHSIEDAFAYAEETFKVKAALEAEIDSKKKEEKMHAEREKKRQSKQWKDQVDVYLSDALEFMRKNSTAAFGTAVALILALMLLFFPIGRKGDTKNTVPTESKTD